MHQHPRRPPSSASPANSPRTNPTRTNNPREGDVPLIRTPSDRGTSGENNGAVSEATDNMMRAPETSQSSGDAGLAKLNQIIQNYFCKAALMIVGSRNRLAPAFMKDSKTKRINKWFSVEVDETDDLKDVLKVWRSSNSTNARPPPLILETYIDTSELTKSQSLVYVDDAGKHWDVEEALNASTSSEGNGEDGPQEVVLERWIMQLGGNAPKAFPDNMATAVLPRTYKNSIVLFRSLFTCARLFPAWRLGVGKKLAKSRGAAPTPKVRYRITSDIQINQARQDSLAVPMHNGQADVIENHAFDPIDSPAGPFSIHVTYRTSCDFQLDDSETFLSSKYMGMDAPFTERPPARRQESAPAQRNYLDDGMPQQRQTRPSLVEQSQAYGSMSTFHQLEGLPGTSPLSALRKAQAAAESPESPRRPSTRLSQASRSSLRSGDGTAPARRPSVSFQPFKTPTLSASPTQVETGTSYPKGSSIGKSSPLAVLAEARHPSGAPPRNSPRSADHSRNPSLNSPKPPQPQRFSSSFGHRKAKLSTGGSKTEDDNSSGKASVTSKQDHSGNLPEGGHSSGSIQTDDDQIGDFLKLIDHTKQLRSFKASSPSSSPNARTTAALSKYQKMRDSNAQLTESLSSSHILHRSSSSSSRQLNAVPPMVASSSSSPIKPVSPQTPHTPHNPSRLSNTSIADYTSAHPRPHAASPPSELAPGAIEIPTSPRMNFHPSYRRSSSAAQGPRNGNTDWQEQDDGLPFPFYRANSLDVDDRPAPSRSALLALEGHRPGQEEAVDQPSVENDDERPVFGPELAARHDRDVDSTSAEQQSIPRGLLYRPHHLTRGRGDTGSSSSLLDRGSRGSYSSGEGGRRGSGRFSFSSRPASSAMDDELPFAMSDLDALNLGQTGRRSKEDLRSQVARGRGN